MDVCVCIGTCSYFVYMYITVQTQAVVCAVLFFSTGATISNTVDTLYLHQRTYKQAMDGDSSRESGKWDDLLCIVLKR